MSEKRHSCAGSDQCPTSPKFNLWQSQGEMLRWKDQKKASACETFPADFPSFQQLVFEGLPELPVLSLNLIAPNGFVSHDLVPVVLWAPEDFRHLLGPSAGSCRAWSSLLRALVASPMGIPEKGIKPRTAEAKRTKLNNLGKKVAWNCFRCRFNTGARSRLDPFTCCQPAREHKSQFLKVSEYVLTHRHVPAGKHSWFFGFWS